MRAKITIKFKKVRRERPIIRYDVTSIPAEYKIEISNRFNALYEVSEEKTPDELANDIKNIFHETAQNHLSRRVKRSQPWISQDTLTLISERQQLKKFKNKDARYRLKSKEVKSSRKRDKANYLRRKCDTIEACMARNHSRLMFDEIKSMTR